MLKNNTLVTLICHYFINNLIKLFKQLLLIKSKIISVYKVSILGIFYGREEGVSLQSTL